MSVRFRGVALALVLLVATAAGCSSHSSAKHGGTTLPANGNATALSPLHAIRGDHPAILDAQGRQVILRGVNLNSLGDYYQADPNLPTTIPVTNADWDAMAAQGFDVVRLLVSWSKLEPERGHIDEKYIARIKAAVDAAGARGIYTVIDMHQDAWGKFVASPPGTVCPPGKTPAIGWDGAPQWATLNAGADTCRGSSREDSEAVRTAWDAFWSDRDGIQTELTKVWNHLATTFARSPSVAGYDLLNEPGAGHDATASATGLADYYRKAIASIRDGERAGGGTAKPIFFEYSVDGVPVPPNFSDDPGLVFAPHIYGGSIAPLSVDANWSYALSLAKGYRTTLWSGEYGWFTDPAANEPKVARFGQLEDQNLAGSAWWQWRQACGDPHTLGKPGGHPDPVVIQYNRIGCPGDHDLGAVPEWKFVLGRPYARAAPGQIVSVASDPAAASLRVAGNGAAPNTAADLWVPDGHGSPRIGGNGISAATIRQVPGGFRVTVPVCQSTYEITVNLDGAAPPATCPTP